MSRSVRVLHIVSGVIYGGVESALLAMAAHRDECPELEQHFAYCSDGRFKAEILKSGAISFDLGPLKLSHLWSVARGRAILRRILMNNSYDAVVCHSPWTVVIFGQTIKRRPSSFIYWLHDVPLRQHKHFSVMGVLERLAKRVKPELVICNSKFTMGYVNDLYPGALSKVIYCPVELPVGKSAGRELIRQQIGASVNTVVIVQVSRLQGWKGHMLHLKALGELNREKAWQCWIVGGVQEPFEEEYLESLEYECVRLGISDRVKFLGQRSDVSEILMAADIFCQPNIRPEPFGIVFVEALNAGLPTVSCNFGGASEIISQESGILVSPEKWEELASVLEQLVGDSELRNKLGRGGKVRAFELCDPTERIRDVYVTIAALTQQR